MLLLFICTNFCRKKDRSLYIIHYTLHIFNRFFKDRFGHFADMESAFLVMFHKKGGFSLGREPMEIGGRSLQTKNPVTHAAGDRRTFHDIPVGGDVLDAPLEKTQIAHRGTAAYPPQKSPSKKSQTFVCIVDKICFVCYNRYSNWVEFLLSAKCRPAILYFIVRKESLIL